MRERSHLLSLLVFSLLVAFGICILFPIVFESSHWFSWMIYFQMSFPLTNFLAIELLPVFEQLVSVVCMFWLWRISLFFSRTEIEFFFFFSIYSTVIVCIFIFYQSCFSLYSVYGPLWLIEFAIRGGCLVFCIYCCCSYCIIADHLLSLSALNLWDNLKAAMGYAQLVIGPAGSGKVMG